MGQSKEGILRRGEALESEEEATGEEGIDDRKRIKLPTEDLVLDASGSIRTTISEPTQRRSAQRDPD